ncbi:ATP-binding protein [Consotaella salsifontis]|uniref:Adenylate kinase n=1 Tax=Consotaella salsifontis TaxID=1365950 RepID=A0A1T4STU3_9HYPH|nr:ATP-binding protein [Consotaella salsifontis]SKA31685.1 adenylate kinase [Consotaella salsifontis]
MPKVVYVTGAPAAGKSSTLRKLAEDVPALKVWEYGARLTEHLRERSADVENQADLRSQSASIVKPSDVAEVDQILLYFVELHRTDYNILIDSHPETKEEYGYRITPFSLDQFTRLAPDEIWLFYVSPDETRRRISLDAAGRPLVTEEEARMHTALQSSVAATYGMAIGRPVYLFDTAGSQEQLAYRLRQRLQ